MQRIVDLAVSLVELELAIQRRPVQATVKSVSEAKGEIELSVPCSVENTIAARIGHRTGAGVTVDNNTKTGRASLKMKW